MICFKIEVNHEEVCTAGVGEFGVLTASVSWVQNRRQTSADVRDTTAVALVVGGLTDNGSVNDQFVDWVRKRLSVGDEVRIRVIDSSSVDEPAEKSQYDPADRIEKAREYYEEMRRISESEL